MACTLIAISMLNKLLAWHWSAVSLIRIRKTLRRGQSCLSEGCDSVTPSNTQLREALEQVLSPHAAVHFPIIRVDRLPSAYRSSYPLDEIHVSFSDGTSLDLIFKDLSRLSLAESVRQAKPEFLHNPLREIETYRSLLAENRLGTAGFYGAVVDDTVGRYWLFLEKVPGDELYKIGDLSTWESAARWLAGMHAQFSGKARLAANRSQHLLKYDAPYYRLWMNRALSLGNPAGETRSMIARRSIERLGARYDRVIERLAALPETFIHGEFYASNVLVGRNESGLRVCPIDWEMAAVGPGLIDLAALVSGHWTEEQQTALAMAYHASLAERGCEVAPPEVFLDELNHCRLHLAVQWLGWSNDWTPPAQHAQDWLGEALHCAERVGCL
jgi:hypothetical protein